MSTITSTSIPKPLVYGSRDRFLAESLLGYDLEISAADRPILRPLAREVADLAARPVEQIKRELWYRHNSLQSTRPLVFCDLENGWNEVIPPRVLKCAGGLARQWELILRKEIFWATQLCDDAVIRPHFDIPHVHTSFDWGVEARLIGGSEGGVTAYTWEPPIKSERDIDRLRKPRIVVDYDATRRLLETANNTFGDLLNVRVNTRWLTSQGMTAKLAEWRGLEQMMYDMVDNPDLIHRLMAFLTEAHMAMLDYLQEQRLLTLNNDGTYVGQGGFGWTTELPQRDFGGAARLCDLWGNAESQETICVSPEMFSEFVLPYQSKLLDRFGLNCYGCCEPLDVRWNLVEQIPRLRRVSVSAWADPAAMAEKLGDRYVYSMKPNPTDLAMPTFDETRVREELRQSLHITRNCHVEILMKDNHTIGNDPQRAIRWVQIARQEAERL